MMLKSLVVGAAALLVGVSGAKADSFGAYGATTLSNNPPAFQLTSDPGGTGYAGLHYVPSGTLLLNQIVQLRVDYEMNGGTFGNGAPRFSIGDTTNNTYNQAYIYFGTPQGGGSFTDPNSGSTQLNNTGNYADLLSADLRVQNNGFGTGIGGYFPFETWAQFVADLGTTPVGFVSLDLDGGYSSTQAMLANNFQMNNSVLAAAVPVPASVWGGGLLIGLLGAYKFFGRKTVAAN